MDCLGPWDPRNDMVVSSWVIYRLHKPPNQNQQAQAQKAPRKACPLRHRTRKHFENTYPILAKCQTPMENASFILYLGGSRQPAPITPQGGSRAEWEAGLSCAWQKQAGLLFPCPVVLAGPHGLLSYALPRGTRRCNSPAKVVSVGPSGELSLHLHPAAMRLRR